MKADVALHKSVDNVDDYLIWRWEATSCFSVKSTYRQFIYGGYRLSSADLI